MENKQIKETIKDICKDIKREVKTDIDLLLFLRQEVKFTEERIRGDLDLW